MFRDSPSPSMDILNGFICHQQSYLFLGGKQYCGNDFLMLYRFGRAEWSNSKADVYRDRHSFQNNCCNWDVVVCVPSLTGQNILANWQEIT